MESLVNLVKSSNLEVLKVYINDTDITELNKLLYLSAEHGNLEFVKYLIDCGADEHLTTNCPLIYAIENGHLDIVIYLIEHGANIMTDIFLNIAIKHEHTDITKCLIKYGPIDNQDALEWAIRLNNLEVVKCMIDPEYNLQISGKQGITVYQSAIKMAISFNHLNILKYIVNPQEYGASSYIVGTPIKDQENNIINIPIYNYLHEENKELSIQMIKYLFDHGICVNYIESEYLSNLTKHTDLSMLKCLIKHGLFNNIIMTMVLTTKNKEIAEMLLHNMKIMSEQLTDIINDN